MLAVLFWWLLAGPAPVCGADAGEPDRRALVAELNLARLAAGATALEPHPVLCRLAGARAAAIGASGDPEPSGALLHATTRSLYRGGYRPHFWSESAVVGGSRWAALDGFRQVRPDWHLEAMTGDYEDLGVGVASFEGQPVVAVLLALPKCTVEWRRAEPLLDLEAVRAEALAAVNRWRGARGRQPLERDRRLDDAARRHAEDMLRRGYYDHRSPDGGSPWSRARAAGYPRPGMVAENIAKGLFTPAEAVDRWMDSSGHRRNILLRRATATGLGVAVGPGDDCVEVVWAQLIAG